AIALPKRSLLTTPNGSFDYDKAVTLNVATQNEYRQNLINLLNNTGSSPTGSVIKPATKLPSNIQALSTNSTERMKRSPIKLACLDRTSLLTLTVHFYVRSWLISLTCRSAGFSDLWVPSKSKYCDSDSSTSSEQPGFFLLQYADKSFAFGPIYTDIVTVSGITASNQMFSPVTTLASNFEDDPSNGILGLAFPAISNLYADPFFVTANKQGTVECNDFGFYLASTRSELYLGGTDSTRYSGELEYHDIKLSIEHWQPTGASMSVGNTTVMLGIETIIDSGTSI
ncbi:hypothetical protein GYMLUDRAFT_124070, partial [Collybiopsis luxurians FD-317 M1]